MAGGRSPPAYVDTHATGGSRAGAGPCTARDNCRTRAAEACARKTVRAGQAAAGEEGHSEEGAGQESRGKEGSSDEDGAGEEGSRDEDGAGKEDAGEEGSSDEDGAGEEGPSEEGSEQGGGNASQESGCTRDSGEVGRAGPAAGEEDGSPSLARLVSNE